VTNVPVGSDQQRPSLRSQTVIQTLGRLLGTAAQAVTFALFARAVAPAAFGEVAVLNGSTTFVSVLLDFGLPTYISKQRALGNHQRVAAAVRINAASTIGLGLVTGGAVQVFWRNGLPGITPVLISLANTIDKNVETLLAIPLSDGATRYSAISFLIRRLSWLLLFVVMRAL
jgi:O-antigen/teichoic acid export membrane protein